MAAALVACSADGPGRQTEHRRRHVGVPVAGWVPISSTCAPHPADSRSCGVRWPARCGMGTGAVRLKYKLGHVDSLVVVGVRCSAPTNWVIHVSQRHQHLRARAARVAPGRSTTQRRNRKRRAQLKSIGSELRGRRCKFVSGVWLRWPCWRAVLIAEELRNAVARAFSASCRRQRRSRSSV